MREECLTSLRERSRNLLGQCSDIAVADIVFIKKDGTARSFWKLTKVVKLLRGKDGVIRTAEIRLLFASIKGEPVGSSRNVTGISDFVIIYFITKCNCTHCYPATQGAGAVIFCVNFN